MAKRVAGDIGYCLGLGPKSATREVAGSAFCPLTRITPPAIVCGIDRSGVRVVRLAYAIICHLILIYPRHVTGWSRTMQRLLLATMFGLGFGLAVSEAGAQTISDRIANPSRKPGTPVVIGTLGEPIPLSVEELTKRSDLILEAGVSWLKSYINAEDTAVITDYTILPIRILAGTAPVATRQPGVATALRLSVYGGEVTRDGVTTGSSRSRVVRLTYSSFKQFGKEPGVYDIYNVGVFELSDNVLRPLARQPGLYNDFSRPYSEVVTRVMAAARAR